MSMRVLCVLLENKNNCHADSFGEKRKVYLVSSSFFSLKSFVIIPQILPIVNQNYKGTQPNQLC